MSAERVETFQGGWESPPRERRASRLVTRAVQAYARTEEDLGWADEALRLARVPDELVRAEREVERLQGVLYDRHVALAAAEGAARRVREEAAHDAGPCDECDGLGWFEPEDNDTGAEAVCRACGGTGRTLPL